MTDYLLQEDGSSKFILEDSSGDILLESSVPEVDPPFIGSVTTLYALTLSGPTHGRVSQQTVEALRSGSGHAVVSQESAEVLRQSPVTVAAGVSQVVVEVLWHRIDEVTLGFIASRTTVYTPTVALRFSFGFIASRTVVYTPIVEHAEVDPPFIASQTRVFGVFSVFTDFIGIGPGNGGEQFTIRLAPNGTTVTATLSASITSTDSLLLLSGDSGLPSTTPFCLSVDAEVMYVVRIAPGSYRIRGRGKSNTAPAAHLAGASATWGDTYDMAIVATDAIYPSFDADITSSGLTTYPGWLIAFDSTQAYLSGSRYPMRVTEVVGVFDAGAGATGTNRCDAAQPDSIASTTGTTDNCPAALSNPSRIQDPILPGDVALLRYTNAEASALDLGPRSTALQSWFGLKRVDATDHDVTFSDPTGNVIDGSVNGEWLDPLGPGVAPDTGLPTAHDVPYTSVTLPGTDRYFTNPSRGYSEKGWPICALAVRQGDRRIPFWRSWDWRDFNYVYSGFGTDATFCQILVNRNGIVFGSVPEVALPGSQDIDGPDAVWDDGGYYFGASWYVAIFGTPYLVVGPSIGGNAVGPVIGPGADGPMPGVSFGGGGTPSVVVPATPFVEGGSGGGIYPPTAPGLHVWSRI